MLFRYNKIKTDKVKVNRISDFAFIVEMHLNLFAVFFQCILWVCLVSYCKSLLTTNIKHFLRWELTISRKCHSNNFTGQLPSRQNQFVLEEALSN